MFFEECFDLDPRAEIRHMPRQLADSVRWFRRMGAAAYIQIVAGDPAAPPRATAMATPPPPT
jgi:hypothetical protein